jgi:hypothetical protein
MSVVMAGRVCSPHKNNYEAKPARVMEVVCATLIEKNLMPPSPPFTHLIYLTYAPTITLPVAIYNMSEHFEAA